MQSFTYWTYQSGDKWWTKAIVIFTTIFAIGFTCYVWVSQLLRTILSVHQLIYQWFTGFLFVENFGKYGPFTGTE